MSRSCAAFDLDYIIRIKSHSVRYLQENSPLNVTTGGWLHYIVCNCVLTDLIMETHTHTFAYAAHYCARLVRPGPLAETLWRARRREVSSLFSTRCARVCMFQNKIIPAQISAHVSRRRTLNYSTSPCVCVYVRLPEPWQEPAV